MVPRWTISILTIPGREEHLGRLLGSLAASSGAPHHLHVVFNRPIREELPAVEAQIRSWAGQHPVEVYFNNGDPTISGGRNFQLNLIKTPLCCFIDDDVSVDGELLPALEQALREWPAALVGIPSLRNDGHERVKPRDDTPHVEDGTFRWMVVQGMLAAGYTNLLRDAGGFNPRRRFWGEWTELNLRLWRLGLPTGYLMDGPRLRHWMDAPGSPTRNMEGRDRHVLWGLICTALEYDAVDMTEANETFWRLVEDRYLAYSFGEELSPRLVLQRTLELMPELSAAWSDITAFREEVRQHPYRFAPFHRVTRDDLDRLLPAARRGVAQYRRAVWPRRTGPLTTARRWLVHRLAAIAARRREHRDESVPGVLRQHEGPAPTRGPTL